MTARDRLYLQFVAEEVASALRHRLVNKIAAVGALTFHLRRQLPAATPAAALDVLPLIDAEVSQASQALDLRFVGPHAEAPPVGLGPLVDAVLASLARPAGVELVRPRGPAPAVAADPHEIELAIYCLVDNAVDAVGARGNVTVRFVDAEPRGGAAMAAIEIEDDGPGLSDADRRHAKDPFYTTKPARLGLGLNVAQRIAQRWRGAVELSDAHPGVVARLSLPVVHA